MERFDLPGYFVKNPITKIIWAGWESTTLALQNAGWNVSVEQNVAYDTLRVAIRHPHFNIYGVSRPVSIFSLSQGDRCYGNPVSLGLFSHIPVIIDHMASRFQVVMHDNLSAFQPIDAEPSIYSHAEVKNIEDFMIFKPLNKDKEIIIAPEDVGPILEKILQTQDPKQAEIRENKRKEFRKFVNTMNREGMSMLMEQPVVNPANKIVAQIITE
jgi:hypothetical protein